MIIIIMILTINYSLSAINMPQTFSDDKKIYSVDMMFAYINIFKPKYTKIKAD